MGWQAQPGRFNSLLQHCQVLAGWWDSQIVIWGRKLRDPRESLSDRAAVLGWGLWDTPSLGCAGLGLGWFKVYPQRKRRGIKGLCYHWALEDLIPVMGLPSPEGMLWRWIPCGWIPVCVDTCVGGSPCDDWILCGWSWCGSMWMDPGVDESPSGLVPLWMDPVWMSPSVGGSYNIQS